MQPPNPASGTAKEWLRRAKGKLALARLPLPPDGFREDLCFNAQQASELAIKAVYQHQGWMFAYIHDLDRLLDGLQQNGLNIPQAVQEADQLSIYAAQTRYPGLYAPVTQSKYEEAVRIAEAVVNWAETLVS